MTNTVTKAGRLCGSPSLTHLKGITGVVAEEAVVGEVAEVVTVEGATTGVAAAAASYQRPLAASTVDSTTTALATAAGEATEGLVVAAAAGMVPMEALPGEDLQEPPTVAMTVKSSVSPATKGITQKSSKEG